MVFEELSLSPTEVSAINTIPKPSPPSQVEDALRLSAIAKPTGETGIECNGDLGSVLCILLLMYLEDCYESDTKTSWMDRRSSCSLLGFRQ